MAQASLIVVQSEAELEGTEVPNPGTNNIAQGPMSVSGDLALDTENNSIGTQLHSTLNEDATFTASGRSSDAEVQDVSGIEP